MEHRNITNVFVYWFLFKVKIKNDSLLTKNLKNVIIKDTKIEYLFIYWKLIKYMNQNHTIDGKNQE